MKPSSAKNKGRLLQKWVRDRILSLDKSITLDDVRSTSMGAGGEDILLSTQARKIFPFSVECKSVARVAVYQWYEQAVSNCPKGVEPIVVFKANNRKPMVMVDAEYFIKEFGGVKKK